MENSKTCPPVNNAAVVSVETLSECSNDSLTPVGKHGPVVVKIPVVIAEPRIQVDVESVIRLNEPALEIKRIKKNVFLTQCKFIWTGKPSHCDHKKTGKLFISGFVRKNIEYATAAAIGTETISGDIRHTTANVPFRCVTEVIVENEPVINPREAAAEIELFTDKINVCDPCQQNVVGRDPCEQDFIDSERFTERIFCELEEVKIFEEDIHRDPAFIGCTFPVEQTFQEFTEKMVLFIRLKLLQKQQVHVPHDGYKPYDGQKKPEEMKPIYHGWM